MPDERDEALRAMPKEPTGEQLDGVVGAVGAAGDDVLPERDVRLPKSYPPWPGSS